MSPARRTTTSTLEQKVNKRYGKGTLIRASAPSLRITRIATGIMSVDDLTGGGFARGRYLEAYGNFSVGKTFIAMCLLANAQRLGLRGAYIDAEHSYDPVWGKHIGVNNRALLYHEQESGNRCVAEDSIITTNQGLIPIAKIRPGTMVLTRR